MPTRNDSLDKEVLVIMTQDIPVNVGSSEDSGFTGVPLSQFTHVPGPRYVSATPYNNQFTFVTPFQHGISPSSFGGHVPGVFHQGGVSQAVGHQFVPLAVDRNVTPVFQSVHAESTRVPCTVLNAPGIGGSSVRTGNVSDEGVLRDGVEDAPQQQVLADIHVT
ncbi:hypothetical protein V6N11_051552 [Hibiscus sabdariffa]|uniref:Uncharacterized protein n=1 Tax=Hibiscus sabdariffa TaxID=183260 RepID=A0ABR2U7E5_9ROSI